MLLLAVGALLSLAITRGWEAIFPSRQEKDIAQLRKDYRKSQKKPAFQFYLNQHQVSNGSILVIPTTNSIHKLKLWVKNCGDLTAEQLNVEFRVSSVLTNLTGSGNWEQVEVLLPNRDTVASRTDLTTFINISQRAIHPGNYFKCDGLILKQPVAKPYSFSVGLVASALRSDRHHIEIVVRLLRGTGESFVTEPKKE